MPGIHNDLAKFIPVFFQFLYQSQLRPGALKVMIG
jgi:hypothetical protein